MPSVVTLLLLRAEADTFFIRQAGGLLSRIQSTYFFYKKPVYKKPRPSTAKLVEKSKKLRGLKSNVLRNFLSYNVLNFLIFSTFLGNWWKIEENMKLLRNILA